jgi:fructosamine-3-kinase
MRRKITNEIWMQIETAYASGIGLREIARNMDIPEGTILSRAKREGWTQQIQSAKALVKREDTTPAVAPFQAVAATLSELGKATRIAAARVHHRVLTYAEILPAKELIKPSTSHAVKNHVQSAGLVHGWAEQPSHTQVNVNVLSFAAIKEKAEAGSE